MITSLILFVILTLSLSKGKDLGAVWGFPRTLPEILHFAEFTPM
jgi:hypothetical protein